ncbi:MAG: hypothetical protein Tsb0015_08290 [Simkaniaceae bacterium]
MKSEWGAIFLLACFGMAVSFLYFGGLWLSVKWFVKRQKHAFLMLAGLFLRLLLMGLAIFYVINQWQITGLISFLAGFFLMKYVLKFRIKGKTQEKVSN